MRRILRWLAYGLAVILGLLLVGAFWVWLASSRELNHAYVAVPERLVQPSAAQLADAPRQATVLGCLGCHGAGLSGRKFIDEPGVGTIWAPNLTEVAGASDQQLARAIRQGIGIDGRPLWIMPSEGYSRMSDADVSALITWIRSLPRSGEPSPPKWVGPLGRFGIATGRFRSAPVLVEEFRARVPYDFGAAHAAGRNIAAVNCAECHGPDLSGGNVDPETVAPGLAIAGVYDLDQFRTLMRTGRPPNGRDLGLMARVARRDFSHLTDAEIAQLHAYLKARAERVQDPPRPS